MQAHTGNFWNASFIRRKNTWYTISDGNWTNPNIWMSTGRKKYSLPQNGDDVVINHVVTQNFISGFRYPNLFQNLYINGSLTLALGSNGTDVSTAAIGVTKSLICTGLLSSSSFVSGIVFSGNVLYLPKTYYNSNGSTFTYAGNLDQDVIDLNYSTLSLIGSGQKNAMSDITCGGLNLSTKFELSTFNLNCTGNVSTNNGGILSKQGSGNILIQGLASFVWGGLQLANSVSIEFQNGLTIGTPLNMNTGTGIMRFTTNNQNISVSNGQTTLTNDIRIANNITITLAAGTGILGISNIINGEGSNSRFINTRTLYFTTQTAAENSMIVGIDDFSTNVNTLGFVGSYSCTIPSWYGNTFSNLIISGTGTKSISNNLTINNLNIGLGSVDSSTIPILECLSYNLIINGTSTIGNGIGASNTGILSKSGIGNILFNGLVTIANTNNTAIQFSGNPNVEVRNGISLINFNVGVNSISNFISNLGSGTWSFTNNNQGISDSNGNSSFFFKGDVIINSTFSTIQNSSSGNNIYYSGIYFNSQISGSGTLLSRGNVFFTNSLYYEPSCIFDTTTNSNATIVYLFDGDFTIIRTAFNNLTIGGIGTKKLSGDTTVRSLIVRKNLGYLDMMGFNLNVSSTSIFNDPTLVAGMSTGIKNSGNSNLTLNGLVIIGNTNTSAIDFSTSDGNIEFRGGVSGVNLQTTTIVLGSGSARFTTNNQSISCNNSVNTISLTLKTISIESITLSLLIAANNANISSNLINGIDINSKFLLGNNTIFTYIGNSTPMSTGILDTSTNLNTFIYGSGAQNIKGGTSSSAKQVYRNLTLNGGGVKTLQGFVSVLNTYTLTSPATLNTNGFSLTNP